MPLAAARAKALRMREVVGPDGDPRIDRETAKAKRITFRTFAEQYVEDPRAGGRTQGMRPNGNRPSRPMPFPHSAIASSPTSTRLDAIEMLFAGAATLSSTTPDRRRYPLALDDLRRDAGDQVELRAANTKSFGYETAARGRHERGLQYRRLGKTRILRGLTDRRMSQRSLAVNGTTSSTRR